MTPGNVLGAFSAPIQARIKRGMSESARRGQRPLRANEAGGIDRDARVEADGDAHAAAEAVDMMGVVCARVPMILVIIHSTISERRDVQM